MKLWSKEALAIGGIYSVLSTPFLIWQTPVTEQINMFLFSIFIISMFMLYWPKFSLVVSNQTKKFPRILYYLMSIGWIPYFVIIGMVVLFIFIVVFSWQDNTIETTTNIFNLICSWGAPVSLVIAYVRVRNKAIK